MEERIQNLEFENSKLHDDLGRTQDDLVKMQTKMSEVQMELMNA